MKIEFDHKKDALNREDRNLSLAEAASFDWDSAVTWPDTRRNYGENRMCALGYIGSRLHAVVFVDRGDARRIISLRKANKREEKRYASS